MTNYKKKLHANDDGTCSASVLYKGTTFSLGVHNTITDADKAVQAWVESNITARQKGKAA